MTELKPCPRCEGKAITGYIDDDQNIRMGRCDYVICSKCGLWTPFCFDKKAATDFWNTRAIEERLENEKTEIAKEVLRWQSKWLEQCDGIEKLEKQLDIAVKALDLISKVVIDDDPERTPLSTWVSARQDIRTAQEALAQIKQMEDNK